MSTGMRVLRRVFVWGRVAAKRHAARLAAAQMDPARPDPHAFLAFENFGQFNLNDRVNVRAGPSVHLCQ